MSRLRIGIAISALLALAASGGQGVMAFGASSPAPPPAPGRAQSIVAEQSQAAFAGEALGIGRGEKLIVKDVITDADGTINVRYNRTFDGLRVIGGDLVSHRDKSGKINSVSWNGAHQVAVASTTPKISLASAKADGARKASSVQKTTSATTGELVVYSGNPSPKATPKLAYDVVTAGVRADQTPSRLHAIVDAITGATLLSYDEIENGTGHGVMVGNVTIGTTGAAPAYQMRDAVGNNTTDLFGATTGTGTQFADADNTWGNGAVSDRASAGVDAQYGAEKTFDYFKNVQGRNGIWNTGVGARSRVHYGNGYENAFWDGTQMSYGDGAGNTHPLTEIDVAGHEMTHGVTERTAALVYTGESGGLNEATSDIFGTAVEFYANDLPADNPDYLIGEKINLNGNGTPLRYMDRPSRDGISPDCWSSTVGNLNVHYSSGPLNHWFYLASEGSGAKVINGVSYNSPVCTGPAVSGIGRDAAAKIWFRTLTVYLTSSNTYAAAREGAIQSAKDLYGATSTQCTRVAASFSAIGVPPGATACGFPTPPAGSNLLRNPGFESGNTLWSATPAVIGQWGGEGVPHSGLRSAVLCGYGVTHYDSISQVVTIPAGSSAILSYYLHIYTAESGTTPWDTMKVSVGSTVLQTLSNLNAASGYQHRTVNLSAYVGRTISLTFSAAEDNSNVTGFVLDDTSAGVAATRLSDFNRDALTDLIARDVTGKLWLYPGNGAGGFLPRHQVGAGWNIMTAIVTPGDVTGDGNGDIIARDTSGRLWLYPGNGASGVSARRQIGAGWQSYTITNAANMNTAGRPDLLARDPAGNLWLYPLSGNAVFGARTKVGSGWGSLLFRGPGDFSGDGRADILARTSAGKLLLYRGNGAGGVGAGTVVSSGGWAGMIALVTPGNWDHAVGNDVLARDAAGLLWLYPGNNASGLLARRQIGSGWSGMNYIG